MIEHFIGFWSFSCFFVSGDSIRFFTVSNLVIMYHKYTEIASFTYAHDKPRLCFTEAGRGMDAGRRAILLYMNGDP